MANEQLLPWINSAGAGGERNSMVSFPCDGKRTAFEFNFAGGYIDRANIKAYTYEQATGLTSPVALVPSNFLGPNTLSITPAIPAGFYLVVYRDTQKTVPLVNYATGAVMDEKNLDMSNQQAVFVAAEMVDRFDAINASSADAVVRSVEAVRKADEALNASGKASTDAADALAASGQAVRTANEAKTTADGIDAKATKAMEDGAAAVLTAEAAKVTADAARVTANGIDGKAQQALDNSVGATNIATNAQTTAQAANTTAGGALNVANGIDEKASAALAMTSAFRDNVTLLYGVEGCSDANAYWSRSPTQSAARQFRLKVKRGVLARPGSANGPAVLTNFDQTLATAIIGPNGQDGSLLNDTTARVARIFIIYGESVAPKLLIAANPTPNLAAGVFAGYTAYAPIATLDTIGLDWAWHIKLTGNRVTYFGRRQLLGITSPSSITNYTFSFLGGNDDFITAVEIEGFLNIGVAANSYGEFALTLATTTGNDPSYGSGEFFTCRAIGYGTSMNISAYGSNRGTLPYPIGGKVKVYTSAVTGALFAAGLSVWVFGYTVANNAIN